MGHQPPKDPKPLLIERFFGRQTKPVETPEAMGLRRIREDFAAGKIDDDELEARTRACLINPDSERRPPPPPPPAPKPNPDRPRRYDNPTGATGPGPTGASYYPTGGYNDLFEYQRHQRRNLLGPLERIQMGLTTANEERAKLAFETESSVAGYRSITVNVSEASKKIKALYGIPEHYLGEIEVPRLDPVALAIADSPRPW